MNIKKIRKIIVYLFLACMLIVTYSYLESRWIKVNEVETFSEDLPGSFDGVRIVFIADIHHGPYFSIERVSSMTDKINSLKPDIIIMGGDYSHRKEKYIVPFFDSIKPLYAPMGIYAVLGNHDHWESSERTWEMMKRNGINICDNRSYWVKHGSDSIKIGGAGDLWEDVQLPDSCFNNVDNTDFCILISHNPDYLESVDTNLTDLSLSGHTHGGQVTLFGLWAPILPSEYGQKYRYGLIKKGKMQSYITSGMGTITPPLRFFCRPEIVVMTLRKGKQPV